MYQFSSFLLIIVDSQKPGKNRAFSLKAVAWTAQVSKEKLLFYQLPPVYLMFVLNRNKIDATT